MWCNARMAFVALRWKVILAINGATSNGRIRAGTPQNTKRVPDVSPHRLYRVEVDKVTIQ
jgi:hypothetical protein